MLSRSVDSYVLHFQIEGSSWNSGATPWEFYVNVGVCLMDIPLNPKNKGLWAHAHAVGRLEGIVETAPPIFRVGLHDAGAVATELAALAVLAVDAIPPLIAPIRQRALDGLWSPLPVPDIWENPGGNPRSK